MLEQKENELTDFSRDHFGEYRRMILNELERLDAGQTAIWDKIEKTKEALEDDDECNKKELLGEIKEAAKAAETTSKEIRALVDEIKLDLNSQKVKLGTILSVWGLIVMALSGTLTAIIVKFVINK